MAPNVKFHFFAIQYEPECPLKRRQPLYKGQDAWSQGCPLYERLHCYLTLLL